jgi:dTDP-4-dehydrorhamnose reductase
LKTKVLLLGCHGRLGLHLLRCLLPDCEVLGLGRREETPAHHENFTYARLQGVGKCHLREHFKTFHPDVVMNAAAWTDVDGAESNASECWITNVDLVSALIDLCRPRNVWLAQSSTDYVFAGSPGSHEVDDLTKPLGTYARSKLAAENLLRGCEVPHAIFRTIVLYGHHPRGKKDFFAWALDELRAKRPIRVVDDQVGQACWAMTLAAAMVSAMYRRRHGVFHVASHGRMSRFQMTVRAAEIAGLDTSLIEAISTKDLKQLAPRPMEGGLHLMASEQKLGLKFPTFDDGLWAWLKDKHPDWILQ